MVLEVSKILDTFLSCKCLNPSLGGIWSWSGGRVFRLLLFTSVLILLWVEYGLGVGRKEAPCLRRQGLNPSLGGIWSWSTEKQVVSANYGGLNPSLGGIWSWSLEKWSDAADAQRLNPSLGGIWSWSDSSLYESLWQAGVLILLWVEYGLGV